MGSLRVNPSVTSVTFIHLIPLWWKCLLYYLLPQISNILYFSGIDGFRITLEIEGTLWTVVIFTMQWPWVSRTFIEEINRRSYCIFSHMLMQMISLHAVMDYIFNMLFWKQLFLVLVLKSSEIRKILIVSYIEYILIYVCAYLYKV